MNLSDLAGPVATPSTSAPPPIFSDDYAIATDKTAYIANGAAAVFTNVSSYIHGINGLMIDISGQHGTITANDFIFKVGNNNAPSTWATAPAPVPLRHVE